MILKSSALFLQAFWESDNNIQQNVSLKKESFMEETILTKIQDEHQELYDLLDQVEGSQDYFRRLELFNRVKSLLVEHMYGEEKTIYARFRQDIQEPQVEQLVELSDREHHQIKEFLQRLNLINFGSNDWIDVFKFFKDSVKKHCHDEEIDMFAEAKDDFSKDELVEIAYEFEEAKHQHM